VPAEADGTSLWGGPEVKRKALLLRPFERISHGACEKCGPGGAGRIGRKHVINEKKEGGHDTGN